MSRTRGLPFRRKSDISGGVFENIPILRGICLLCEVGVRDLLMEAITEGSRGCDKHSVCIKGVRVFTHNHFKMDKMLDIECLSLNSAGLKILSSAVSMCENAVELNVIYRNLRGILKKNLLSNDYELLQPLIPIVAAYCNLEKDHVFSIDLADTHRINFIFPLDIRMTKYVTNFLRDYTMHDRKSFIYQVQKPVSTI